MRRPRPGRGPGEFLAPLLAYPVALAGLAVLAGTARAHGVAASRFDAPLPLSLLFLGAGGTVALTAGWLAVSDRKLTTGGPRHLVSLDPRPTRLLTRTGQVVFGLGVLAAMVVGFAGRQVAAENVATLFVWPVWFRGLALLAVLAGSPWRTLSPWRALYRGLCRLEGGEVRLRPYPARLGHWPALVGFLLLFGVAENLTTIARSPGLTAAVVAAYGLAVVGGAVVFGPVWFERADPLGALYRLFGRVSTLVVECADGLRVAVRPPWRGCRRPVTDPAVAGLAVAAVYTVTFDGFTRTRLYRGLVRDAGDLLGTGPSASLLVYAAGLLAFAASLLVTSRLADRLGGPATEGAPRTTAGDGGRAGAVLAFAPTVVPIAAAYEVAHNYPYVLRNAAALLDLSLAPLGLASGVEPLAWLSVPAFWGSQVVLVVFGHVVGVVAAHRVAVSRYGDRGIRAHLPLVVLMVGYTVLSLWVVSQPVVA